MTTSNNKSSLNETEKQNLLKELSNWKIENGYQLVKEYKFKNFIEALEFTNKVGELAEEQGHHPLITLTWGYVKISIWTHSTDNLTKKDFSLAAEIDSIS